MRKVSEHLTGLQWIRPRFFRSEYELRSGEGVVATLRVRGWLQRTAIVESGDGAWTMTRTGFLRNGATIRASGSSTDVAEFRGRGWSSYGGNLTFASGATFELAINFWMTRLEFRNAAGMSLVTLHRRGVCGRAADVEILPAARALPELPVLVSFGWFLFVMLEQDAAAASAAVVFTG
jgi:hypothetical protein